MRSLTLSDSTHAYNTAYEWENFSWISDFYATLLASNGHNNHCHLYPYDDSENSQSIFNQEVLEKPITFACIRYEDVSIKENNNTNYLILSPDKEIEITGNANKSNNHTDLRKHLKNFITNVKKLNSILGNFGFLRIPKTENTIKALHYLSSGDSNYLNNVPEILLATTTHHNDSGIGLLLSLEGSNPLFKLKNLEAKEFIENNQYAELIEELENSLFAAPSVSVPALENSTDSIPIEEAEEAVASAPSDTSRLMVVCRSTTTQRNANVSWWKKYWGNSAGERETLTIAPISSLHSRPDWFFEVTLRSLPRTTPIYLSSTLSSPTSSEGMSASSSRSKNHYSTNQTTEGFNNFSRATRKKVTSTSSQKNNSSKQSSTKLTIKHLENFLRTATIKVAREKQLDINSYNLIYWQNRCKFSKLGAGRKITHDRKIFYIPQGIYEIMMTYKNYIEGKFDSNTFLDKLNDICDATYEREKERKKFSLSTFFNPRHSDTDHLYKNVKLAFETALNEAFLNRPSSSHIHQTTS